MKVFVEEQRFKRWVLTSLMVVPIVGGLVPLILAENKIPTFESNDFWGMVVMIVSIVLVLLLLLSIKLRTKINEQGIYYQYFPNNLSEKYISWSDIDQCYIKKYNSIRTFGGYGYRRCYIKKRGLMMNVGGKFGIQLVLKNGKKILIGTQNVKDAERVLKTYTTKFKSVKN